MAAVYAACRDLSVPRTLEEVSTAANTDPIFAGKCYRLLVQNLDLQLPVIDSNKYLAKIANKAKVSEKTYRTALEMLSAIKKDPVSHGKDPNALAVAVLYAACLKEGENVSQAQIAVSGDISIVTLRKRFQDVRKNLLFLTFFGIGFFSFSKFQIIFKEQDCQAQEILLTKCLIQTGVVQHLLIMSIRMQELL